MAEDLKEKLEKMNPKEREAALKKLQKKAIEDCLFCKIIREEIPCKKVYETENVLAFLDINPVNPGHTLVIPKKHYLFITQIPEDELCSLIKAVKYLSGVIFEAISCEGITVSQANGKGAGQVIPHVHFHIIPRYKNDKLKQWPTQKLDEKEFEKIQNKIKSHVKKEIKEDTKIQKEIYMNPPIP